MQVDGNPPGGETRDDENKWGGKEGQRKHIYNQQLQKKKKKRLNGGPLFPQAHRLVLLHLLPINFSTLPFLPLLWFLY